MSLRQYKTTDKDIDEDEVTHVELWMPDGPMVTAHTQANLLLNVKSGSGDIIDAVVTYLATSIFDVSRPERSVELEEQEFKVDQLKVIIIIIII
ncbi:hypothetical protein DPMN_015513 [Dreissena polymorpha]|uniref:Uncharacterized protein n=1 Tax=Dreissena polymorpha TaxID=45954 RepID=A0A9D4NBF9_DREPO|nr:hypothetical protein DPMN_015513 [Dreissena polymorpha]